ncbi:PQQ-binding-like beta-propeller repeat protein [Candidatus Palauibacter sp.]|uniref:outer membrane protein assembly factor BamB family protein n=1 Tax=Candidatus Palauibacter sp. TaxID=3101350 RepID=UPI003B5AA40F
MRKLRIASVAIALSVPAGSTAAQESGRALLTPPPMDGSPGHTIYTASCAECHSGERAARAPGLTTLGTMTPRAVVSSLEGGRMRRHGEQLTPEERRAVAEWLTGETLVETRLPSSAFCASPPERAVAVHWSGWGGGAGETGFVDASRAGLTAADLPNLELAWAFGFPDASQVRSKPAVIGDRILVGSAYGEVYSIDLETGCVHWVFAADAAVRGAIAIGDGPGGEQTAFFADFGTNVYAIDAASGALRWRGTAGTHSDHVVTGSVAVHDGRVFVPLSSMEILTAGNPIYECCTSAGGVVAFTTEAGEQLWAFMTVPETPRHVGENEVGARVLAPSGAPVWSSPTVDAARGLLYIGTGENYTRPTTGASDAIIALDVATGTAVWTFQGREGDAWNMACQTPRNFQNCPDPSGPDHDFGMAPILVTREDGSQILVAGQKSGMVWALDPDADGELVWARRIGKGSALGGIHWGLVSDGRRAYVPNVDHAFAVMVDPRTGVSAQANSEDPPAPGVYALELSAGEVLWRAEPDLTVCQGRPGCMPYFSAAPTAIEGAVLAGSLDGHLRAYSTEDGSVLWDVDTAREFETVNGVPGRGGALDGPGPVVAHGYVLVNSGYDLFSQMPGNLLLAYRIRPQEPSP